MDTNVKEKWVDALRSGEYEQTRSVLREGSNFCCLGVLCDIVDPHGWSTPAVGYRPTHRGVSGFPAADLLDTVGLLTGLAEQLTHVNDMGMPFADIADIIEAEA